MNKKLFAKTVMQMRKFCLWVGRMDQIGIDLGNQYLDSASEAMYLLLTEGNSDWDYDARENFSWIIEFTGNEDFPEKYGEYERGGRTWNLGDPEEFYDFIVHMNQYGWDNA